MSGYGPELASIWWASLVYPLVNYTFITFEVGLACRRSLSLEHLLIIVDLLIMHISHTAFAVICIYSAYCMHSTCSIDELLRCYGREVSYCTYIIQLLQILKPLAVTTRKTLLYIQVKAEEIYGGGQPVR
ncbi:hypothetical protein EDB92DRAFT_1831516 [Lactarius akahatsu]|uniref:Uncharacterized protein n=1 Tax=Lactarius akahatsu TaxID=416441 RepID=A0AAD4LR76_9AGAM|nr:hypothetical protein EDB92DRAFT_1831516 [Lactarius akahatsu]